VDKRIRQAIRNEPRSALGQLVRSESGRSAGKAEAQYLAPSLKKGDLLATRILAEIAEDLAFGLSHAVHLFHPEMVILGGGLSKIGAPLGAAVGKQLPGFLMQAFLPGPRIRLAGLSEDAVPVGALLMAGDV
jgi:glucokinase